MKLLLNALGIQDSGGVTVLEKVLQECTQEANNHYLIICNDNKNIRLLVEKYRDISYLVFKTVELKSFLHRLYYENVTFRKLIKKESIDLVYNFSGSAQFFSKIPQITKIQNLLFYCKKIDALYFKNKQYILWLKQIFLRRVVFHAMLRQTKYVEIQSAHVKEQIADFMDISDKQFFVKSDIDVSMQLFCHPKEYDWSRKINFLYIVGPHFEYLHKNFIDFTNAMMKLRELNINFEISVTLTKEQLHNSSIWNRDLDERTNFLGYINTREEAENIFTDNTILVSTSVIETLGLHVVEAVQNGILAISPEETYAKSVYGDHVLSYKLFDMNSLVDVIQRIVLLDNNDITDTILKNQQYLIKNENSKYHSIINIFEKVAHVQK
ncbi:MAG: glycosyltransferase [Sulfurospirillaceae bacterium]|nr:glycosyltransferase [Sulfurospirillaceae bacterium]